MLVRAKNARCISKDEHTWDNGEKVYRGTFANDSGEMLRVQFVPELKQAWDEIQLFDTRYELQMEARTNGFKNYIDLTGIAVSK